MHTEKKINEPSTKFSGTTKLAWLVKKKFCVCDEIFLGQWIMGEQNTFSYKITHHSPEM